MLFAVMLDVGSAVLVWLAVFGFVIQIAIPVLYCYVSELYPTPLPYFATPARSPSASQVALCCSCSSRARP